MVKTRAVFSGAHIAKSMRSIGYKNTIYALAEIIDNSVEAEAKHIEILCAEKQNYSSNRSTKRLDKIAIIDDGVGMNKEELWEFPYSWRRYASRSKRDRQIWIRTSTIINVSM